VFVVKPKSRKSVQSTRKDMDSTDRLSYRTPSFALTLLPLNSAAFTYL
jgi:hypothetical protein